MWTRLLRGVLAAPDAQFAGCRLGMLDAHGATLTGQPVEDSLPRWLLCYNYNIYICVTHITYSRMHSGSMSLLQ